MDFRQLNYIVTISEHKNITKAAKELYISQSSLSHFLAKTEEELDIKLFDRNTNPISLTYAGERYVETAREILKLSNNLKKEFSDIKQCKKGKIVIGVSQGRGAFMLPLILKEYRKEYPKLEIRTLESNTSELKESLMKGLIDLIIMPEEELDLNIEKELIYEEELLLISSKDYIKDFCGISNKEKISLNKVKDLPFILLKKGHGIRTKCDSIFIKENINPKIVFETTSNTMALRLASIGEGVSIVPKRSIVSNSVVKDLDVYQIDGDSVKWNIIVAYRKDVYLSKIQREFIDTTKDVFCNI